MKPKKSRNIWLAMLEYVVFAPVLACIFNFGMVRIADVTNIYVALVVIIGVYFLLVRVYLNSRTVHVKRIGVPFYIVFSVLLLILIYVNIENMIFYGLLTDLQGGEFPSEATIRGVWIVLNSCIIGPASGLFLLLILGFRALRGREFANF